MDIEKLKPWNWFKHEENSASQVPVANKDTSHHLQSNTHPPVSSQAMGSLFQLHQEMDRLFNGVWHSFGVPSTSRLSRPTSLMGNRWFDNPTTGNYRAKLDVSGDKEVYKVSIDLPGLAEEDIQIELNGNTLSILGKIEEANENKDKQYYRVERCAGSFQRTLSLPEDADGNAITANLKNGLLVILIPRKALPPNDVKRISIS